MRADAPAAGASSAARHATPHRWLPLVLAGALAGCFEEPVEERVHLCFQADGSLVVTAATRVNEVPGSGDNAALLRRLNEVRQTLERGDDDWRRRFGLIDPLAERVVLDRVGGALTELRRSAAGVDAEGLRALFADAGVAALLQIGEGRAELAISAGPSRRATREQRQAVGAALERWCELLARYTGDADALFRYLGERPERARACLSVLFSALTRSAGEELEEREAALVGAVDGDVSEAVRVFDLAEGEAYTVNELSHLVFDPFPGRVIVHTASAPEEVEGFARLPDGSLEIPGLGLWEAFAALAGRWLEPDPLLTIVEHQRDRSRPFDLDAFISLPRRSAPPADGAAVRTALARLLAPAPVYRAVWAVEADGGERGDRPTGWDAVRCP
jgi:hypothetical protein